MSREDLGLVPDCRFQYTPITCPLPHNDMRVKEFKGFAFRNAGLVMEVYQCPGCGLVAKFPREHRKVDLEDPEYIKRMTPTDDWVNRMLIGGKNG